MPRLRPLRPASHAELYVLGILAAVTLLLLVTGLATWGIDYPIAR